MCGIFCSVSRASFAQPGDQLRRSLKNRGPDSQREYSVCVKIHTDHECYLNFTSTVLALRGDRVQSQPLVDDASGSVLCWNGEAWKVDNETIPGNDSLHIFQLLLLASQDNSEGTTHGVLNVLNNISGPFAFVFYDGTRHALYYGRDRLGRRSLLQQTSELGDLKLCSVTDGNEEWSEVSYDGVQVIELSESAKQPNSVEWNDPFPAVNGTLPTPRKHTLESSSASVSLLQECLFESMRLRAADIPSLGHFDLINTRSRTPKVAILFSGGLDCTVLARIAHEILDHSESIDLLNVAFENPRSAATARASGLDPYELCPDRITGRRSFAELCSTCPGRAFRFVAVDVPFSESQAHRPDILHLMRPHNTEMDLSIAMALYFASRGQGTLYGPEPSVSEPITTNYMSSARVLLSGLGADELFAGYTRHATAFNRRNHIGLIEELSLDITRLGQRNLGRDDRIISHWGKEVRYPYLDEDLVRWALRTPVWEKCGFGEDGARIDDVEPAKKVLRLLAKRLGMEIVAQEKKRAIQFGARTAKMEGGGKTKGTDILT